MSYKRGKFDLCAVSGHSWAQTTSDNYRICERSSCRYAEIRRVDGTWEHVPARKKKQVYDPSYATQQMF